MKKLFLLLTLVGMIFTACESGGGVEEENGGVTPFIPEIKISPTTLTYSCNGGEQMVNITANFEYEIAEQSSWITIEQTDKGLVVIVDANKNTTERSAFVSVSNSKYDINKSIEVRQEGFVPKIELAEQSIEVEFEPAEYSVEVTSPYSWKAVSDNDWIVVETKSGIAGTKTLKFSVARNEDEEIREGTITLKNTDYNLIAELYVTQKAFVPIIKCPESLTFAVEGGTQEVAITSNFEYVYNTNADWLSIEKNENGIKVTAPNYVEVDERSAKITISNEKYGISKVVEVSQGAFVPELTISPETLNFACEGGTQEVAITANFEYEVKSDADWLSIEKNENGIKVTAPNYVEVDERSAEITISSEKYGISKVVEVSQGAFVPELTISPETLNFACEGGTQEVAITSNFEYVYNTNADWLSIEKNENGIKVTVEPNANFNNRSAEITISSKKYELSKKINIYQSGLSKDATNYIIYTSSDGNAVSPHRSEAFGATILSNTYENGQGIMIFDTPITSIGEDAFYCCYDLTSITIPNSVTSIGERAFDNCYNLTAFYGKCASADNRCLIIDGVLSAFAPSGLTEYTIPSSVTSIGSYAFSSCKSLTSLTIGNSVTSIGVSAFENCYRLTSVTIPDSVTEIGSSAFWNCKSLTNVTIPDSVTEIRGSVFSNCISLTNVTIGNSVTSIGGYAFYDCYRLTSVTIPDSVTEIGSFAFYECKILTSVTIGNSVTSIGGYAFYDCNSLTSVTIPDSVTEIGYSAFNDCGSLTSVTIGNSVTSIGEEAFYKCTSLTSVYCKPTTPPAGSSSMFSSNASDRKIYVPRASVSAYKSASYWRNYSSKIVGYDF